MPLNKKEGEAEKDQAIKHGQMVKSIQSLKAQFCIGQNYFRYDPDQLAKFNEMYYQAKQQIMEICDGEFKKAAKQGKKYKGNFLETSKFIETNLAFKFFAEY